MFKTSFGICIVLCVAPFKVVKITWTVEARYQGSIIGPELIPWPRRDSRPHARVHNGCMEFVSPWTKRRHTLETCHRLFYPRYGILIPQ
uniref:Secreted protein n=1 Tax=Mesocestoides corti TaxID=53468 RepID=A0A5K3FGI2_MESCO